MFSCRKNTQLISDNLDRKLTRYQRLSMTMHGLMCSVCRTYRRQVEALDVLIKQHYQNPPVSPPHDPDTSKSSDASSKNTSHQPALRPTTRQKLKQLIAEAIARRNKP